MGTTTLAKDRALLLAAEAAVLAPSVHNTQPWRFVRHPNALDIIADHSRRLAVVDPTGRQWYLSVGCALFNARVALAAAQVPVRVTRFPDRDRPQSVARITIDDRESPHRSLAALAPVIALRQTNRRRFADDAVPDDLLRTVQAAAASEDALLRQVVADADRETLAHLSQLADVRQITDPAYRAELRAWTSDDPTRLDGVRAAVVPHVDGTSGDEVPIRDFDTQGVGWLPAQTRSSARQCLVVLGTDSDGPLPWLRAGEALERVWLEITRAGFVASLFTQVVEVAALRAQLRDELRLGMQPHVVLRIGRASVTASTLRRHVADVMEDQDGPR